MINGKKVFLVKPQTYMNLSGESVKEVMSFYKVPIENLIVVFDDISLPMSMIRLREKGSAGGHNGIKNIISHMGIDKAAEAVEMMLDGKMRDAMNKFNKKVKEEKPEKKNKNEEENNDGNENR